MNCNINFYYEDKNRGITPVFKAKLKEYGFSYDADNVEVSVGLGNFEEFSEKKIKALFAGTVKELKKHNITKANFELGEFSERFGKSIISQVSMGINLGLYEFDRYKSENKAYDPEFTYTINNRVLEEEDTETFKKAKNVAEGVAVARDLVNTPANNLTPVIFSETVEKFAKEHNIEVEILDEIKCRELGMNTFLAVGESSSNPPRLIVIRYLNNSESNEVMGLVGKGVTYDTGGYSLKPSASMLGMKTDMAGAAAVCGAIYSLAKNKVKTNVIGILPCCENRLSNSAYLPGDVVKSMNGKTIEITNTDAEGRLILSDAITYAIRNEKVSKIVDIATLTGSVVATLGHHISGAVTNKKSFFKEVKKAGKRAGEKYHLFPIDDTYRKVLESDLADIKNSGSVKFGGCIVGGCFIEAFVEDMPWVHLDIAGTSYSEKPLFDYNSKGATGVGAATLYELCAKHN